MYDGWCLFLDDLMSVFGMFKRGHKVSSDTPSELQLPPFLISSSHQNPWCYRCKTDTVRFLSPEVNQFAQNSLISSLERHGVLDKQNGALPVE